MLIMLQDEAGVLQLPKQLHEMYLATRNLFDPLCFANLCKSHLCWWIDLSKWFCSDKAMDVCATFHQRSSQRRCVSPGQISMQKRAIVARCCKMFQDVSRNRKVLGGFNVHAWNIQRYPEMLLTVVATARWPKSWRPPSWSSLRVVRCLRVCQW